MANKYERIADTLRAQIRSGALAPGQKLPSETTLADEYDVSVPTLRATLRVLRAEGLIEKRQGIGNFVRGERRRVRRTPDRYQWEKDRVRLSDEERVSTGATEKDRGLTYGDLRFSAEYDLIKAQGDVAEVFGVPTGTEILQRTYRTQSRHEDAPISLVTSYMLHEDIAANPALLEAANEPWPGGTQHQLSTVGIEVGSIEDQITTRPPSVEEADQLGIDPEGVAVFVLRKISRSTADRVVEVSEVILPGDRTEFVYLTQLTRWDQA